jgi:hypothetical protein
MDDGGLKLLDVDVDWLKLSSSACDSAPCIPSGQVRTRFGRPGTRILFTLLALTLLDLTINPTPSPCKNTSSGFCLALMYFSTTIVLVVLLHD